MTKSQVVYPVGVTKCEKSSMIFYGTFKSLHVTATQMIAHHSVKFYAI